MKNLKKILSIILTLALIYSLCSCGNQTSVTKQEVIQMIEDASQIAYTAGYFEGLSKGLKNSESSICSCSDCVKLDTSSINSAKVAPRSSKPNICPFS